MVVVKIKWKNPQKGGRYEVGNKIKMTSNMGIVGKIESNHENLS